MRNLRFYTETEPGLLERRTAGAFRPGELDAFLRHLRPHYDRVFARPELAPLRAKSYRTIRAFGGGLPSFEAHLYALRIEVIDLLAAEYSTAAAAFADVYPSAPPVHWVPLDSHGDALAPGDCLSCCHVLEHLPLDQAAALLGNAAATGADVLIYGPNADRCTTDTALHLLPVHEHLWLGGLDWTRAWAERATGRPAQIAIAHDLDLLIWLPAGADSATPPAPKAHPKPRAKRNLTPHSGGPGGRVPPAAGGKNSPQ